MSGTKNSILKYCLSLTVAVLAAQQPQMILKSIKDCCKIIVDIPLHSFAPSFHASIQSRSHEAQYHDTVMKDLSNYLLQYEFYFMLLIGSQTQFNFYLTDERIAHLSVILF